MNKMVYIFGAGISGITLARKLAEQNWQIKIFEKNNFVGGNCYDYFDKHNVLIHKFGPHIFHTDKNIVQKFIKKFAKFREYEHHVRVNVKNQQIPLPINFKSLEIIFKKKSKIIIAILKEKFKNKKNINLSDLEKIKNKYIQEVYNFLYRNIYANYTSKMWGISIKKISHDVINRVKINLSYQDNYFPNDKFIGIPKNSYSSMMKNMLSHKNIQLFLNQKGKLIFKNKSIFFQNKLICSPIVYCGAIDELFNYKFGKLPYRSLNINFIHYNKNSYQKSAVINYPAHAEITRITEYKKLTQQRINGTTISKEIPGEYSSKNKNFNHRFYPINNIFTSKIYNSYYKLASKFKNLYLLGRLAQYKYFDMDDAIFNALELSQKIINNYE